MIANYNSFKTLEIIENYIFTDNISDKEFEKSINGFLSQLNEKSEWKAYMSQKLASALLKIWDGIKQIKKIGIKLIKKLLKACWVVFKAMGKWCDKNKNLCVFAILIILMITVGAVSAYATTNPTDPNLPELANAALGFIDQFSDKMIESGNHESSIQIAKSILTQIRNGGESMDYSQISKEGQAIANTAMKIVGDLKESDPENFQKLADTGSKISSQFTYIVNGMKVVIGKG